MKTVLFGFAALVATGFLSQAMASDLIVASAMQRCTTNEECTLVTNSCADNCGFVPVNKLNLQSLQGTYQQRCGKPMEANPSCNMNPPISAACINSRCTIDYAYQNNADAKDYKPGAYPVPQQAVPSKVPATAAPANDRQGFTAYDLPQDAVRQESMGEIKVYVPPSAPVSGGNYVPVGAAAPTAPVVQQPAIAPPVAPPIAPQAPTQQTYATPPQIVPAQSPVGEPRPPQTDFMPDSQPRRVPPTAVKEAQPIPQPTATTTPAQIATPSDPIPSSAPDTIKEPRVPDDAPIVRAPSAVTGNPDAPVPPSDFKEHRLAPPPGATIPVGADDPGALPPPNVSLQPPLEDVLKQTEKTFSTKTVKQDKPFN